MPYYLSGYNAEGVIQMGQYFETIEIDPIRREVIERPHLKKFKLNDVMDSDNAIEFTQEDMGAQVSNYSKINQDLDLKMRVYLGKLLNLVMKAQQKGAYSIDENCQLRQILKYCSKLLYSI